MRHAHPENILPMLAALRAGEYQLRADAAMSGPPRPCLPFVTISRQAGAGGRTCARELVNRLNEQCPGELPWTVWDNELVERVAEENHLPPSRVAALEDVRPSWLETALGSLTVSGAPVDELTVFRRVAATIRALAEVGRVVIVGRGAAFVTADMPGGTHVRLVAPVEDRVRRTAQSTGTTGEAAAEWVRDTDAARLAFYRRHFPDRLLTPESFTATFNTAAASADRVAGAVIALMPAAARARHDPVPIER
jgi:cytidylate kinase